MGLIISRFRRKRSTTQILEKLETKIKSIEERGQWTEQQHKRVIGHMMAYSVGLYVLFAVLYYYVYSGRSQYWLHSLMYASPLLVLPILVFMLRSSISWYYVRKLRKDRLTLSKVREEKKKILEEVMNTETYKVAKEILDKFGTPEQQSRALKPFVPSTNVPGNPPCTSPPATPGQLRQRQLAQTSSPMNTNNALSTVGNNVSFNGPLRSNQLPRPLLGGQRTALDRVVDFLMRDGPGSRIALICSECFSHNGMAMPEEYEFVSYYCAYCRKFNPARKQKPIAPSLTLSPPRAITAACDGDDSSVISSASDSEDEKKPNGYSGSDGNRSPSPTKSPKTPEEKKED